MKGSRWIYAFGLVLFIFAPVLYIYLVQPFPGSQELDAIGFARSFQGWVLPLQVIGGATALLGLYGLLRGPKRKRTWAGIVLGLVLAAVAFFATRALHPQRMFQPFETVTFAQGTSEELPGETLVMGIVSGEEAKAYPLRLLAYHHQLEDTLAGQPIWVTYCGMCKTAKVFRTQVAGRSLSFDLVGARRWNSVYEDHQTGTWWYQANGRAAVGPLAGERLPELLADQMTLERWLELHPESLVLQPDPAAAEGYTMFNFDQIDERRDDPEKPEGWRWVVGVENGGEAVAYPWALLSEERLIEDEVAGLPVAVHLHEDLISFRVWDRRLDGRVLDLEVDPESGRLVDPVSGSSFGFDGVAEGGELDGRSLVGVDATLEYWHSFDYFSNAELYAPLSAAES